MGALPAGSYLIELYFTTSIISLFFLFFVVDILSTVVTLSPLTWSAKPPRFNTFFTYLAAATGVVCHSAMGLSDRSCLGNEKLTQTISNSA